MIGAWLYEFHIQTCRSARNKPEEKIPNGKIKLFSYWKDYVKFQSSYLVAIQCRCNNNNNNNSVLISQFCYLKKKQTFGGTLSEL